MNRRIKFTSCKKIVVSKRRVLIEVGHYGAGRRKLKPMRIIRISIHYSSPPIGHPPPNCLPHTVMLTIRLNLYFRLPAPTPKITRRGTSSTFFLLRPAYLCARVSTTTAIMPGGVTVRDVDVSTVRTLGNPAERDGTAKRAKQLRREERLVPKRPCWARTDERANAIVTTGAKVHRSLLGLPKAPGQAADPRYGLNFLTMDGLC